MQQKCCVCTNMRMQRKLQRALHIGASASQKTQVLVTHRKSGASVGARLQQGPNPAHGERRA